MNNPEETPTETPVLTDEEIRSIVVYTPETIVGDDDIIFDDTAPPPAAATGDGDGTTYTVRFKIERNGQPEANDGLAPITGSSYPAPNNQSPVKGALFQVGVFLLQGVTPVPLPASAYTITGLNGLQKKRRRTTFDFALTAFSYPAGYDSVNVLLVVNRKNADNTEASTALVIRVHKPGA